MTLARCRKCGKIASTAAKNCPHCGVRNPTRKPAGPAVKFAAAFGGIALLLGAVESSGLRSRLSHAQIELPRIQLSDLSPVPESPEKKRAQHRFEVTVAVASTIKQSMDNPHALVWETILSDDDASVICFEYRVRGNQGEYSREYITYVDGKASEAPEDWNRHCAGKKLNDMSRVKKSV